MLRFTEAQSNIVNINGQTIDLNTTQEYSAVLATLNASYPGVVNNKSIYGFARKIAKYLLSNPEYIKSKPGQKSKIIGETVKQNVEALQAKRGQSQPQEQQSNEPAQPQEQQNQPQPSQDGIDMNAMNAFTRQDAGNLTNAISPIIKKISDKSKGAFTLKLGKAIKGTYTESLIQHYKKLQEAEPVQPNNQTNGNVQISMSQEEYNKLKQQSGQSKASSTFEFQIQVTLNTLNNVSQTNQDTDTQQDNQHENPETQTEETPVDNGAKIEDSLHIDFTTRIIEELGLEIPDFLHFEEAGLLSGITNAAKGIAKAAVNDVHQAGIGNGTSKAGKTQMSDLSIQSLKTLGQSVINSLNKSNITIPGKNSAGQDVKIPVTFGLGNEANFVEGNPQNNQPGIFTITATKGTGKAIKGSFWDSKAVQTIAKAMGSAPSNQDQSKPVTL